MTLVSPNQSILTLGCGELWVNSPISHIKWYVLELRSWSLEATILSTVTEVGT
jgi:hypothetical protein